MASANTPSANEPAKDLILVHTVQLKTMIKAHFSGKMVSSGISDVGFASVYSEKTVRHLYWWMELCVPTLHTAFSYRLKLATDFHLAILLFLCSHIFDYSL